MLNFILALVVFAASAFLIVASIRYGIRWAKKMDAFFRHKSGSSYPGFRGHYRLPLSVGLIPEFYFYLVLGYQNYFGRNWWSLKAAALISFLVFIASLKSRSAVYEYFTLHFIIENGFSALLTSGVFVWYLNVMTLLSIGLLTLIIIESIRMHSWYAPARIIVYSLLSFLMAVISLSTLWLIVMFSVLYFVFKVIGFFFSSSSRKEKSKERGGSLLRNQLSQFREEILQWENERPTEQSSYNREGETDSPPIKKPVITRRKKPVTPKDRPGGNEVPRLRPD